MRKKTFAVPIIISIFILTLFSLQQSRIITLDCLYSQCFLGGTCARFEGKNKCLMGYEDGSMCKYCATQNCSIGESSPLYVMCMDSNDKQNKVRVIITLNIDFKVDGDLSDEQVKQQRLDIKQAQQKIKDDFGQLIEVYNEFEFIPSMAVIIDDSNLETLKNSPQVKSIQIDTPESTFKK